MTYVAVISGRARASHVFFQADTDDQAIEIARGKCDLGESLTAVASCLWEIREASPNA